MGVFEKALISGDGILDYIPQRAPIVMVDGFYGIADNVSVTTLTVTADNIFCRDGVLDESGIIEHIAQSAAARSGYEYRSSGRDVPIGYIGSVEKLAIHGLPAAGDTLRTEITHEQEIMNITLISARTTAGGVPVAECRMKIFLEQ